MNIKETIQEVIQELINKKNQNNKKKIDNWPWTSPYLPIREMTNDDTGDVGELLLEKIFRRNGYRVVYGRSETSEEKDWDIEINGKTIEVKTATIGKTTNMFQHEKFYQNRNYDIVAFIDITAKDVYCTMGLKKNINWKNLHQRKVNEILTDEYKFDFDLSGLRKKELKGTKGIKLLNPQIAKINNDNDLINLFNNIVN